MRKLKAINMLLQKIDLEIVKYNPRNNSLLRRKMFFCNNNFDLVIDVGANIGSFGLELREIGYQGSICSFEPIKAVFNKLTANAHKDLKWKVFNFALGLEKGNIEINISKNLHSSSILDIMPSHITADPTSAVTTKEIISMERLDNIFPEIASNYKNIYLKIDTQGYEYQVISGGHNILSKIKTIQVEMSLKPLYEKQVLFDELYLHLTQCGYSLINIEPGFSDPRTGELLQIDGIFTRK